MHLGSKNKKFDYFMDNHKLQTVTKERPGCLYFWDSETIDAVSAGTSQGKQSSRFNWKDYVVSKDVYVLLRRFFWFALI